MSDATTENNEKSQRKVNERSPTRRRNDDELNPVQTTHCQQEKSAVKDKMSTLSSTEILSENHAMT